MESPSSVTTFTRCAPAGVATAARAKPTSSRRVGLGVAMMLLSRESRACCNEEPRLDETPPLQLESVGLTLPSAAGPVEILKDLSLTLEAGERMALVGRSGSGKSSLIAVAAGLERPTRGRVTLFGSDLRKL